MRIEVAFDDNDRDRLGRVLGGQAQVDRVAKLVAAAGAKELLDQATGISVPGGPADARSYRIFCLLSQGMDLREAETLVAHLFKVTPSTARSNVSAAVARYAVELAQALSAAVGQVLDSATWDADRKRWNISVPTTFIRDQLLDLLSRTDLPDPEKAGRGAVWRFPDETYQWLRAESELRPRPTP